MRGETSKGPRSLIKCAASAGTGKTYTLAAHYVALLMNGESHKSILAVTFTNKATAEMKERILTNLNAMATASHLEDTKTFMRRVREVSRERGLKELTDAEYSERAFHAVRMILSDYDNMKVTTIDSFLQTLLSGLAQALGQMAGFGVDLDVNHAITAAVDQVLATEVAESAAVREAVADCIKDRMSSENKWDLRPNLIKLAKELYHETVQQHADQIMFASSEHLEYQSHLRSFKQRLDDAYYNNKAFLAVKTAYEKIAKYRKPLSGGTGGKNYGAFYRRLDAVSKRMISEKKDFNVLGASDFKRFSAEGKLDLGKADLAVLIENVGIINDNLPVCKRAYYWWKYRTEYVNDLMLVGFVSERIKKNLRENNTILLAETSNTLAKALKTGDAEFILLKAGVKYKHIMLDEFQDTSTLQWENFERLIHEILNKEDGSTLIVGDVKQSIYRWRNGDYAIMNGLDVNHHLLGAFYNQEVKPLSRNMRSKREIVQFNLETMSKLAETEADETVKKIYDEGYVDDVTSYYRGGNDGGYVHARQYKSEDPRNSEANEKARKDMILAMFTDMEKLLEEGYSPQDMLILIRTKKDADRILAVFYELIEDGNYAKLKEAGKIVSGDSFVLESSKAVNIIVNALKVIYRSDEVAKKYLELNAPKCVFELSEIRKDLPLNDLIETISQNFLCAGSSKYEGKDIAHLNCFKDKTRSYISRYGSNAEEFLKYWDDKMHEDSIPATDSDDIRIMTIHAAKGLEAKNVFIPYCNWNMETDEKKKNLVWCEVDGLDAGSKKAILPIPDGAEMPEVGFEKEYIEEHKKQRIDNLNLLYVALTRAENNLFVYIFDRAGDHIGKKLIEVWSEIGSNSDGLVRGSICYPKKGERKEKMPKPFSFEIKDEEKIFPSSYQSSDQNIVFRQSQEAQTMMLQLSGSERREAENTEFGNLCHAVMAKIRTREDIGLAIDDFYHRGIIPDEKTRSRVIKLVGRLVDNVIASKWFDGTYTVKCEETVVVYRDNVILERRMDRLMTRGDEAIVLDYKFGSMKEEYSVQVREYMSLLREFGYKTVRGYIWLAYEGKMEEITNQ